MVMHEPALLTVNLAPAKAHLSERLDKGEAGEDVAVTGRGRVVGVIHTADRPKNPPKLDDLAPFREGMPKVRPSSAELRREARDEAFEAVSRDRLVSRPCSRGPESAMVPRGASLEGLRGSAAPWTTVRGPKPSAPPVAEQINRKAYDEAVENRLGRKVTPDKRGRKASGEGRNRR